MNNVINYLKIYGIKIFIIKLIKYPFVKIYRHQIEKKIYNSKNPKYIFTNIYNYNWWGSTESRSGVGSTIKNTIHIRKGLIKILEKYKIRNVFDAPCGDMNWIYGTFKNRKINYEGWDIVDDLIIRNQKIIKNKNYNFKSKDITSNKFPKADLMICRDCFIHFSYKDICRTLENFVLSDIKYLLLTNYENNLDFVNKDILTGESRIFDLFKYPFSFNNEFLEIGLDDKSSFVQKKFLLFNKNQIIKNLKIFKNNICN